MLAERETIEELTGAKTKKGQIEWLAARGYAFDVNRIGWPVVLKDEIRAHMLSDPGGERESGYQLNL